MPHEKGVPSVEWKAYNHALRAQAFSKGRPVIIDFYADWCLPCKELDRFSFSDRRVVELSTRFLTLKADLTRQESPEAAELTRHFDVKGVPTIVFLDGSGKEIQDLRLVSFEAADALLARMRRALEAGGPSNGGTK